MDRGGFGRASARVALNRALSKLSVLSRAQATVAVRGGRVTVDGRVVRDPLWPVVPGRARIAVDGVAAERPPWRALVFHKPRGVVTTRRDPEGRPTIYDALGDPARGLIAVGRLDLATSGLLLLTNDTPLANWITDPAHAVPRVYVVTVRGRVSPGDVERLRRAVQSGRDRLRASSVVLRKVSGRESHLTVELREGRNREVRRLFDAIGHEVTRLARVALGGLALDGLASGDSRPLSRAEVRAAFPGAASLLAGLPSRSPTASDAV
jgi:23S rRNA pseudouridine2605 synthase